MRFISTLLFWCVTYYLMGVWSLSAGLFVIGTGVYNGWRAKSNLPPDHGEEGLFAIPASAGFFVLTEKGATNVTGMLATIIVLGCLAALSFKGTELYLRRRRETQN
jgi:hypothetical protein